MTKASTTHGSVTLWGLWGGLPPGGWSSFFTGHARDTNGHGYAGTFDQAEAGRLQFEKEQFARFAKCGRPERDDEVCTYTVAPFDPNREPESLENVPTSAQWWMLAFLRKYGTINHFGLPSTRNATLDILHRNGWYRHVVTAEGREPVYRACPFVPSMVLTAAGERAVARLDAATTDAYCKRHPNLPRLS